MKKWRNQERVSEYNKTQMKSVALFDKPGILTDETVKNINKSFLVIATTIILCKGVTRTNTTVYEYFINGSQWIHREETTLTVA